MNPITGVTIGAGFFSDIQQEAWKHVSGARIAAVADLSVRKARQLASKYSLDACYADAETMLRETKPDFVDICTPPDTHLDYVRMCIRHRIPILCQKPLAPSWQDSVTIVEECRNAGVPLMVNENWRWQCWYREMGRLLEAGVLGHVYHVVFTMRPGDGWGLEPYPLQTYFRNMPRFLLYETGIHWIDTFRFLFGEVESVYCAARTINKQIVGEDHVVVHVNFCGGTTGLYDANRVTEVEHVRPPAYGNMTVEGTKGRLRLDEQGRIWIRLRGDREREHSYEIREDGWRGGSVILTQQHFVDGLMGGGGWETSGERYLQSIKVMYACYHSAETGQTVRLDDKSALPFVSQ